MSCPKKEVELILGCRNGVAVYKREKFLSDGTYDSSSDEYSDGLGSLGRTPGECQAAISQKDPEIVCMTNDGGETVIKGVVIFSYDGTNWTSTVNNLDGSVATGYTVIPCSTTNQVIEGEARCDAGTVIVPFYDVETDGVASANVAFWFNPVANAVIVPSGTQTLGACVIAIPDRNIDIITDCGGATTPALVNGKVAEEVIIGGASQVLNVRIVEDCEVKTEVDYEYVCNKVTGFYDLHIFTTVDGVTNSTPTITATTIVCDVPQNDFETQSYCNAITKTTWIRSVSFTQAGIETVLSDIDTNIACIVTDVSRPLTIETDCAGTTTVVNVDSGFAQEVVISPDQILKVVVDKSCDVEQTLADHQNGCLERSIPSGALVCNTVVNNFNFSDTDFVDFVIDSNDGNGNYVITQNFSNPAAATVFLNMTTAMNTSNSRSVEDIANGAVFFYFGDNNFGTVTQISPTSIQFQTFLEAGVNDVPPVLSSPCTDPITNTQYQDSSTTLRGVYDSQTIGVPVPNGGSVIVMTVTTYSVTTGGDPVITHIPAKQVVTYDINGNPVSDRYFEQSTLTEIIFDPATDVFKNVCTETITIDAQVPNCAGGLDDKPVNSLVGAYLLNQENKHTETVYDILTAVFGGTVAFTYTAPRNVAVSYASVTLANDTVLHFRTDFGDGYNDVGPTPDHIYNADGSYEIKTYAILNSKNKILINAKEVIITNGVVAYAPTGTSSTINRSYRHVVNTALQNYCGNTPVDNPYLADGTSYTPTGTLGLHLDAIIDELEDNAEWNPENVADLVECVVGSANLVTEALDVNLGAIKEVVSPGSTLTTFHTLLGNNLDIQGDGLTNLMGAGINANISGSTYIGAQFTYTFNLIGEDDPGDPADFGITVWDNVAGTSVTATSITSTATYVGDAQGVGLNMPFYAWGAPGTYTIVWTGDLPVGDYTIGYVNQNFSPADHVELQVTHNLVDSMTTSKAQLVALDQCTINALTPVVADLVECEVISGGGVVTEGVDANLNAISTLLGIPTPDNRHILLGNTLSISSTGSSNVMAAGLNVAATGLITGAQFTFNIDLIADSDPGDPADFGVVVWDNVAGTSVLATSITAPFPMSYDPQGSGLNFPIYANPVAPQSFQVVWTGDLPAGDYTVGFILQDQNAGIGADSVNLSVTHNITAGNTTTTKAQLVALDQCTINALTPEPVVAPIEVPNGRIIINPASMLVIVGSSLVRSFSVKGLDNAKYNISFDNSATWLTDIDGGDSWGEGNEDNLNISQVVIQPTVSGDRVFIHWETI